MTKKHQMEVLERMCEITSILYQAKKILDTTGDTPIPYETYSSLIEERRSLREELKQLAINDKVSEKV